MNASGPALAAVLAIRLLAAHDDTSRLYTEAKQAQAAGDLTKAARNYEAIVRLHPRMAEAFANLGNVYYQMGQPARARTAYEKATELKPNLAGPWFFLGVMAFGRRDYSGALRDLEKARTFEPANGLIDSYLGYTYYARGDYRRAAGALEHAFYRNANDIDVLYHLSKCYGHLAGEAFEELQNRFPDSSYANLLRAQIDNVNEQYGDSPPSGAKLRDEITRLQSKSHTLTSEETSAENLYLRGQTYQALSYVSTLAVFDADSDSYRSHQLRAQMLEQSKDDDGAIQEYRKALERKPDLQNIHFAVGSLYWKDQHFDEARAELLKELKMNRRHPQALYELGDIFAFAGNTQAAEKYLVEAIRLEPSMVEAHLALEKIYTQTERYDKSLVELSKAAELNPADPTPNYRRATIYRKLGKAEAAETELATFRSKQAAANAGQRGHKATASP